MRGSAGADAGCHPRDAPAGGCRELAQGGALGCTLAQPRRDIPGTDPFRCPEPCWGTSRGERTGEYGRSGSARGVVPLPTGRGQKEVPLRVALARHLPPHPEVDPGRLVELVYLAEGDAVRLPPLLQGAGGLPGRPCHVYAVRIGVATGARMERIRRSRWRSGDCSYVPLRKPLGGPLSPNTDYHDWKRLLEDAGVRDGRLHDARHTAATVLMLLGVPARKIAEAQRG